MGTPPMFEIAGRKIGRDHSPYIVAELSGNHNGDIGRALALVDAAADTGADAIKIQSYTPETITVRSNRPEFTISAGPWAGRTLHDLYAEAHTPFAWHERLFWRALERGVPIFSSPFDDTAVDLLSSLGAPAYKVASFEIVDIPLIRRIAREGKPIIIATGMANLGEIGDAVAAARGGGLSEVALLHCTSAYPATVEDANVRTVRHLGEAFGCVSGVSDHTPGIGAAVAAVALGGAIVEKHITLARSDGGPDAAFSLEPDEFGALVRETKAAWASLGRIEYEVLGIEAGNLAFRRSLRAVRPIAAGEILTTAHVRSVRPAGGLEPKALPLVLGQRAKRAVEVGEPIDWDVLDSS